MMIIHATEAGLYANICDYLRHAYHCTQRGEGFMAMWSRNSLYFDEAKGPNVFEYFFKQPHPVERVVDHAPAILQGYTPIPFEGEKFRIAMHQLQSMFLTFNLDTQVLLRKIIDATGVNKKTLGVHVRFTDKHLIHVYGEPSAAKPLDVNIYITAALRAFQEFEMENVFLATDDQNVVFEFARVFGGKLITLDVPRSTGVEAVHSGMRHISGYTKAFSVIADVELLSRCGYLIRSTSNVSSFAQFKNLELNHLNLNEVILGDTREQEYGLTSKNHENLL